MNIKKYLLIYIVCVNAFANEAMVKDSLNKYLQVFDQHKVEYIEKVIAKKYLKQLGGKKSFTEKVKSLDKLESKYKIEVEKTTDKNVFKARYIQNKKPSKWFLFKKEDKSFKLFGTYED